VRLVPWDLFGARDERTRIRGASRDLAVACIHPTPFVVYARLNRLLCMEADQGAILLPINIGAASEDLEKKCTSNDLPTQFQAHHASAVMFGYRRWERMSDSLKKSGALDAMASESGQVLRDRRHSDFQHGSLDNNQGPVQFAMEMLWPLRTYILMAKSFLS